MDLKLKKTLRGISLEIRRLLEGRFDERGAWQGGDLERRLNEMGVWRDREAKPVDEMPHLSVKDKAARRLVDGFLLWREQAGVTREAAVREFVCESAYTWANRLFALRCMEARGIIDEVILQKTAYAGRSLAHSRFARKDPAACAGEDDGLFAVLLAEFEERAKDLPLLFDPRSPAVALRPSVAALKRCIAFLSGSESVRGQEPATDEVFEAPDAFGWAYQYWNADEKNRVFEMVRTKKGSKIQGTDIIPATQLYTEPYMVKFLVQNSLGALWMGMYPDSKLCDPWEYYVKDADRAPVMRKPVREITFLDPAQGSGHFHLEAFDLFHAMYVEEAASEGLSLTPREICAAILNHNLYGIDIDGRAVQIATAALWMKAKACAPDLQSGDLTAFHEHLVATNLRLPKERDHLELFLKKHPEDAQLRPALEAVFQGLENADELGTLLQIEEPVDAVLRQLKLEADARTATPAVQANLFEPTLVQSNLPMTVEDFDKWKRDTLNRLQEHFEGEAQAADEVQAFFCESAGKGLAFFDVLSRRYDVVAANPPYMGSNNMGAMLRAYVRKHAPGASRDLYGAFLVRGMSLCERNGVMAFVTLESWCFKKAFSKLRERVITSKTLDSVVFLGRHAFSDADPPGLPVMSVIRDSQPSEEHRIWTVRLTTPRDADDQAKIVRDSASGAIAQSSRTQQVNLSKIPNFGFFTWLPQEILLCLRNNKRVGNIAECLAGLQTGDTPRFVRFVWETCGPEGRWLPFVQGGGTTKWFGLERAVVDWRAQGKLIREHPGSCWRGTHRFGNEGLTYSESARGKLAMRVMQRSGFSQSGSGVFPRPGVSLMGLAALLSSRFSSYSSRFLRPGRAFPVGYLSLIPVPPNLVPLESGTMVALRLKTLFSEANVLELSFSIHTENCKSLIESLKKVQLDDYAVSACMHSVEGMIERATFDLFSFQVETVDAVTVETGKPAGWFTLLSELDQLPPCPGLSDGESELVSRSLDLRRKITRDLYSRADLRAKLRVLLEAGPGTSEDDAALQETVTIAEEEDDDDDDLDAISSVPIPAETFVEELSQKLEVHPVSIYWLLREGIEDEGWRCPPEERRLTGDRFTVLFLQLLGHRWPKQIEAGEQVPEWADSDGVIPLTESGGEKALIGRVRDRLPEMFPDGNVAALEREFEQIMGVSLADWLAGPFFERHISQFKKRPIAWQIESDARGQRLAGGKRKRGEAAKPIFSCLVYYHRLDAGMLPKIRTHYVGKLRAGFETELRALERTATPSAEQQGRMLLLDQWIEEMKAFDAKLEVVAERGFASDSLRQLGINDALLSLTATWLRRLNEVISTGPLVDWRNSATGTDLHPDFPAWIGEAFSRLDHFCTAVGPRPPDEKTFTEDPTSKNLAPLVCASPSATVARVLVLGCDRWWKLFDGAVLASLKESLKQAREEQKRVKEELKLDEVKHDYSRNMALSDRKEELAATIKSLGVEIDTKTAAAKTLRVQIERWTCPDADGWEAWLGGQALFDIVASIDSRRPPPVSLAEFIAQESAYAPDINDGVRVNIAPVQKAGLLHAPVLDAKDLDKAIADRADWRADERRWVREGKLPQPGWWPNNEESP